MNKSKNITRECCDEQRVNSENTVEFFTNGKRATVSFSQRRYKRIIYRLAETRSEECQIVAENADGSLCAHVPVTWIKIAPVRKVSEQQREAGRRNILKAQIKQAENALKSKQTRQ